MTRRAVFLDRDGVLNRAIVRDGKPYPPQTLEEFELLPGVEEACARLNEAGFILVVVTNQPDVARGKQRQEVVDAFHRIIQERLPLAEVLCCYHDDAETCSCRKPAPGFLLDVARRWNVDLVESFMVGDRWRDVEAGVRAGCRTVFIDYGYNEDLRSQPDVLAKSLNDAATFILRGQSGSAAENR